MTLGKLRPKQPLEHRPMCSNLIFGDSNFYTYYIMKTYILIFKVKGNWEQIQCNERPHFLEFLLAE